MKTTKSRKTTGGAAGGKQGQVTGRWQLSDRQREKMARAQVIAGSVIIGVCAVAGFFINPAVGIGLAVLVALRLYFLRRELRHEANGA